MICNVCTNVHTLHYKHYKTYEKLLTCIIDGRVDINITFKHAHPHKLISLLHLEILACSCLVDEETSPVCGWPTSVCSFFWTTLKVYLSVQ